MSLLFSPFTVRGVGLHSGEDCTATVQPTSVGQGICFRARGQEIAARPENVVDTSRCTIIGQNGTTISTVEHLMSAFAGLGVTDALIDVDGPELPIGDGSATVWVEALRAADLAPATSPLTVALLHPILVTGNSDSFIAAYPADTLRVTTAISFPHPLVETQIARFEAGDDFVTTVAPARTFGFIEEVELLRAAGLARGGSEENAIVIYPDRFSTPLRFENEFARHKLLDLLGDAFLAGGAGLPNADIIAVKPSHKLNVAFAARLAAATAGGNTGKAK